MTENLAPFFSDFATTVTLHGASVSAIFDNGYSRGDVGIAGLASTAPTLTLPTANVPASPVGKAAVVSSVTYTIVAHEPDGTGVSTLVLERA